MKKGEWRKVFDKFEKSIPKYDRKSLADFLLSAPQKNKLVKVTTAEWSKTHPEGLVCGSDRYYADLCNRIMDALADKWLVANDAEKIKHEVAKVYTAYLEDFVSDTKVWSTMRGIYKERYGSWLPFYDTGHDEYYEDDINIEDLKYLSWQCFSRLGQETQTLYSPYSDAVEEFASIGYEILVDCVDDAPEATRVRDYVRNAFIKKHYFPVRFVAVWLNTANLLTAPLWIKSQIRNTAEILHDKNKHGLSMGDCIYHVEMSYSWLEYMSMIGCSTSRLMSSYTLAFGYGELSQIFDKLQHLRMESFKIDVIKKDYILISDKQGLKYKLAADSVNIDKDIRNSPEKYMAASITKFDNRWYVNGGAVFSAYELINENPNVKFPDAAMTKIRESIRKHNGRKVFYFKKLEEISNFVDMGMFPIPLNDISKKKHKNFVLFLSEIEPPVVLNDACQVFNDEDNPYFKKRGNKEILSEESMFVVMHSDVPDDVAKYIQDNHLLPYASLYTIKGEELSKKAAQENLRFLCGFYRQRPDDSIVQE